MLIAAAMILSGFVNESTAIDKEYIKYSIIETDAMQHTDIVIRAGEYIGKPGKRIYINNQTVHLPNDIPIRNDKDGKGFYVSEADINLKTSKAIVNKLKEQGVNVQLQVANDKSQDLNAAGRIANKSNPYMYISIHHNYYDENSTGYFAMYNQGDISSKRLAARLSDAINNSMVPQRCNQASNGYIGELNTVNCDAVLLELGFFSNLEELEIICSDDYVEFVSTRIANELIKALQNYK
jgi:N-acetylmuramoyl-L-alanine amidase